MLTLSIVELDMNLSHDYVLYIYDDEKLEHKLFNVDWINQKEALKELIILDKEKWRINNTKILHILGITNNQYTLGILLEPLYKQIKEIKKKYTFTQKIDGSFYGKLPLISIDNLPIVFKLRNLEQIAGSIVHHYVMSQINNLKKNLIKGKEDSLKVFDPQLDSIQLENGEIVSQLPKTFYSS